ncbi:hypothetical protein AGR5A_Cc10007 [Agrobacterium genomosp. 5 str. CFBP 6626]|nr:hypothetical protein AGR5A_Cc10007 [Agrobacterium genomosp. 5 str. CFBP 6626]
MRWNSREVVVGIADSREQVCLYITYYTYNCKEICKSATQVALSFAFRCQSTLELLAGDLATDQASQRHHGSILARRIIPVRFQTGQGCNLDIDPVPLDCHRLQKSRARKGAGAMEARNVMPGKASGTVVR